MKYLLFTIVSIFFLFTGCSYYGSINNNSVNVVFPIELTKADLYNLSNQWSIDSTFAGDDHGFAFVLQNDSVRSFSINDLSFDGLYSVRLVFYYEQWSEIKGESFLFYKIDLDVLDSSFNTIYDSLQLQNLLLVPHFEDDTYYFYDMDNNMRYTITPKLNYFTFEGLEYLRYRLQNDYRSFHE